MEKIVFENKKQAMDFLKKFEKAVNDGATEFILENGILKTKITTYGLAEAKL